MGTHIELLRAIHKSIQDYCANYHDFSFKRDNPRVRLHEPTFSTDEIYSAVETMLSTQVTMGKQVREFERQYGDYAGSKYGLMTNSGSSANLLAIAGLANPVTRDYLRPGDEVIVPALSWATTVWPIIQCNLVPVIVDCEIKSFNLDLNKLEAAIGPKTRVIMPVHVYGNPCDMSGLMAIAEKHNLTVIEDCCEALGAKYNGKSLGTFGRIGTFSFYFSHHMTTFEGGICITDDYDLVETLRVLRAHGWSREAENHQQFASEYGDIDPRFIFVNVGYNLRPTEVQAAMGKVQLQKLENFVAIRRENALFFLEKLKRYEELFHFQQETPGGRHTWFGFSVILKDRTPFAIKEMTRFLQERGIETRPIIAGNIAKHPALAMYSHRIAGDLNAADTIMQKGFAFGNHQAIDHNARSYVVEVIDEFVQSRVLT